MKKISKETLTFLNQIKKNNNRDWFEVNKPRYKSLEEQFKEFLYSLGQGVAEFDETIKNGIDDPKTIKKFRIYRDVRFSKDKTPYKVHMAGDISIKKDGLLFPTYYVHIEPGNNFVGGGIFMPDSKSLNKLRTYISKNYIELGKILIAKDFKDTFGNLSQDHILKTYPRGYDIVHPAIDLLRLKSFTASVAFTDSEVLSEDFLMKAVEILKCIHPLNNYLETALHK